MLLSSNVVVETYLSNVDVNVSGAPGVKETHKPPSRCFFPRGARSVDMGKKIKPKEVIKIACSECGAKLLVNKFEATVEPSKKAVKETWVTVEKDTQTKLPGEKKGK